MFLRFRSALPLALARTFSLLVRSFLLLAVRDFTFHDALRRFLLDASGKAERPMAIDSRKLWHGFSQILFHSEGKEDFA